MDVQAMINVIAETGRSTRVDYHLLLGEAIEILDAAPGNTRVNVSANPRSYRGYYEDLSLEPGESTAGELLEALTNVLDTELEGYKGGMFLMVDETPLWRANYGCLGDAIIAANVETPGEINFIFKQPR